MTADAADPMPAWRRRLLALVESPRFQRSIIALILVNAVILGLETSDAAMAAAGPLLVGTDQAILAVFVVELVLRVLAHRLAFFRDPWSLFDLAVVAIALAPATDTFSVLRALRVLRVLRVISAVPSMRGVVGGLLGALPGLGAVVSLLALIFYVAGVIATKLFGDAFPDWFGSLGGSVYSLFQIMTLESWSMGIVRPVMVVYPYAWAFFVPFILIATFTMLNLFIGVVVSAMQARWQEEQGRAEEEHAAQAHLEREQLLEEVRGLREEVSALRGELSRGARSPGD